MLKGAAMEIRAAWNYNRDPLKLVFRLFWLGAIFLAVLGGYYFGWQMVAFMAFTAVFLSYLWKFTNWISGL